MERLVQTSNNVSTIDSTPGGDGQSMRIVVGTLARSSSEWWKDTTLRQIGAVG